MGAFTLAPLDTYPALPCPCRGLLRPLPRPRMLPGQPRASSTGRSLPRTFFVFRPLCAWPMTRSAKFSRFVGGTPSSGEHGCSSGNSRRVRWVRGTVGQRQWPCVGATWFFSWRCLGGAACGWAGQEHTVRGRSRGRGKRELSHTCSASGATKGAMTSLWRTLCCSTRNPASSCAAADSPGSAFRAGGCQIAKRCADSPAACSTLSASAHRAMLGRTRSREEASCHARRRVSSRQADCQESKRPRRAELCRGACLQASEESSGGSLTESTRGRGSSAGGFASRRVYQTCAIAECCTGKRRSAAFLSLTPKERDGCGLQTSPRHPRASAPARRAPRLLAELRACYAACNACHQAAQALGLTSPQARWASPRRKRACALDQPRSAAGRGARVRA